MLQNRRPTSGGGNIQKSSSSKAAALLTRGAYIEYVSANVAKSDKSVSPKAAKWRERRWRLFSTFPCKEFFFV